MANIPSDYAWEMVTTGGMQLLQGNLTGIFSMVCQQNQVMHIILWVVHGKEGVKVHILKDLYGAQMVHDLGGDSDNRKALEFWFERLCAMDDSVHAVVCPPAIRQITAWLEEKLD